MIRHAKRTAQIVFMHNEIVEQHRAATVDHASNGLVRTDPLVGEFIERSTGASGEDLVDPFVDIASREVASAECGWHGSAMGDELQRSPVGACGNGCGECIGANGTGKLKHASAGCVVGGEEFSHGVSLSV